MANRLELGDLRGRQVAQAGLEQRGLAGGVVSGSGAGLGDEAPEAVGAEA
jgi:hypothetical protein